MLGTFYCVNVTQIAAELPSVSKYKKKVPKMKNLALTYSKSTVKGKFIIIEAPIDSAMGRGSTQLNYLVHIQFWQI